MAKNVLIYSTAYLPMVGGAEVAIKEITDRLLDFNFVLITSRINRHLPRYEKIGPIEVYRLGWGTRFDKLWLAFRGGHFGLKLAHHEPFTLVWGVMASFAGLAALRFKELQPELPFLLTLQEGDDLKEVEFKMLPLWWRFKKIFTEADQIQVISSYLSTWAQKMGALGEIKLIPNGVDLTKFSFAERKINQTIITTSRLVKKNGLDTLIRSLLFLPANFRLQIFGLGPEADKLKKQVQDFRLTERVDFNGLVASAELPTHLHQAEIFVRPARSEGLGNSFLEAMACGLPVIGTPVGGIPDFLKEGETGWLVEPDNPVALAEKIKLIIQPDNKLQVDRVVNQARRLVEEKYDWVKIADQFRELLQQLTK